MDQLFSLLPQSRQPCSVLQSLELAHLLYPSRSLFHLSSQSLYHPSTPSLPSLSIFSFAPSRSILLTQIYSFLHPSLPPFILLATAFFNWSLRVSSARPHRSSADIPPSYSPVANMDGNSCFKRFVFVTSKIQPSSNYREKGSHTLSPHQLPHLMLLRWGWLLKRCPNHVDKLQVCNQQHKTENGSRAPPRGNTAQQQHSKHRIIMCHKDGLDHSI